MNIEKKRIEACGTSRNTIGHITLDKLAISATVEVTVLDERINPMSFDDYGHPNFSKEQLRLYMFKEEELKRQNEGKNVPLEATIVYEEKNFDVPRDMFDTIDGIKEALENLSTLNEMLKNRRIFNEAHKNERDKLDEFMLFGYLLLDQFGQVMSTEKSAKGKLKANGDVEEYETFKANNKHFFLLASDGFTIPTAGSVCPCCGKEFTIEDVKNNPCVKIDGKVYHNTCWQNYRKLIEVYRFTTRLVGRLYKDTDYQFELIPNGYSDREYYSAIPWFLFHTCDGDIIMGCRKNVISIEWQANYKPFDMNELFYTENVTKWENSGKRGIHALDERKAYEYLIKVLNTVNPEYSKL